MPFIDVSELTLLKEIVQETDANIRGTYGELVTFEESAEVLAGELGKIIGKAHNMRRKLERKMDFQSLIVERIVAACKDAEFVVLKAKIAALLLQRVSASEKYRDLEVRAHSFFDVLHSIVPPSFSATKKEPIIVSSDDKADLPKAKKFKDLGTVDVHNTDSDYSPSNGEGSPSVASTSSGGFGSLFDGEGLDDLAVTNGAPEVKVEST
ncbi:hypothetical protein BDN72DRAFT_904273 [Pluteus cervinus]|uniref:Uncharacterized protein n=1 Tax=Pluteus cervinus TaxID=181527 RepID=A0ACD3A5T2_9AGAR|nr:hypothetical protein BDN72DRAFT_904273 [Pluteus cervinus]